MSETVAAINSDKTERETAQQGQASALPMLGQKATWLRIAKYAMRTPWRLAYTMTLFLSASLMSVFVPIVIGRVIDDAVSGKLTEFPLLLLTMIFAVVLLRAVLLMMARYQEEFVGTAIHQQMGLDAVDAALQLNAQTIEDSGSGDLVNRVTNDLDAVHQNVTNYLPSLIYISIYLAVQLVTVVVISPVMGVVMLPLVIGMWLVLWQMLPRIAKRTEIAATETSTLVTRVTENVRGLSTARELGIVEQREELLNRQSEAVYHATSRTIRLRVVMNASVSILAYLPLLFAILLGAFAVSQGWTSWGVISTISLMIFSMYWMITEFGYSLDKLREAAVVIGRVLGIIGLAEEQIAARERVLAKQAAAGAGGSGAAGGSATAAATLGAADTAALDTAVAVADLDYGYTSSHPVINDLSLTVRRGESLALVGRSGSGKTTLARLIAGSLSADHGSVMVLGGEVGHGRFPTDPHSDGRPKLLICTQEAHQFVGTLADNLTVVKPNASEPEMLNALTAVGANWVSELPQGLNTLLGSDGYELTRDQVQQMALARIILADPHTVILDESTTQLELAPAAESVQAVMQGRAVIIVSHDARIAGLADRAVLLDEGKIITQGTPAEVFGRL